MEEGFGVYRKPANTEAPNTVKSPATAMDRLLMAPSISPISMAFAVPMAWEAVPSARPLATGSRIRSSRKMSSAMTFPRIPVRMMTATVMVSMPPSSLERSMPMAVVMDFGSSVTYCPWFRENSFASKKTLDRLVSTPAAMPPATAFRFFFSNPSCW